MIFSYPSGISYQRYESWGDEPWRHSEQEWAQRFRRDIGRRASRWRQYKKNLQKRIAAYKATRAAISEELGCSPDWDSIYRAILDATKNDCNLDTLNALLGIG
jgi:hypothetical protein